MAGPVWGTAEIRVTADGTILPSQIRAISERAGKAGGASFTKAFNNSLNQNGPTIAQSWRKILGGMAGITRNLLPRAVNESLKTVSRGFREAFDDARVRGKAVAADLKQNFTAMAKETGDAFGEMFPKITSGFQRLSRGVQTVRRDVDEFGRGLRGLGPDVGSSFFRGAVGANRFGTAVRGILPNFQALGAQVRRVGGGVRDLFARLRAGAGDIDRARKSSDGLGRSWKSLPHGFRQAAFYVGLFTASLAQLSGLGSAVAGSITVLASSLLALGAGAGVAVAGFIGLFEEGAKLSAGAQATKAAFEALGDTFQTLQASITNAMFDNMAGSVERVQSAITALSPAITAFSAQVGDSLGKVFDMFSNTSSIALFQSLFEQMGPIFDNLVQSIGSFTLAILNILDAGMPLALEFSNAVKEIGAAFLSWTQSDEGRSRLAEFFNTARTIMPLVVDLVVAAGQALAGLVTPTTLAGLAQFLTSLTNAMPAVEGLLRIAGNLNIFGILAAALDAVGTALTPLIPPFEELATVLGAGILQIIQALTPVLLAVAQAIAPIVTAITPLITLLANMVAAILPPLLQALMPILTVIQQLAPVIIGALMPAFVAVADVVVQLVTAFAPLLELLGPLLSAVITPLIPLIVQIADVFVQVADAIMPIVEQLLPPLEVLIKAVTDVIAALMPVVVAIITPFLDLIPPLLKLIQPILPPLISLLGLVANVVSSLLLPIIKALTPVFELLAQVVAGVLTNALKVITPIIEAVSKVFTWLLKNVITPLASFISGVLVAAIEGISAALQTVIGWIKSAIDWFGSLFGAADEAGDSARANSGGGGGFAAGGILNGPRRILAGEAGPEAIVPLNRALSSVDPSVRWLSAIAQGKGTPSMASGGIAGGGKVVNIESGAILVQGNLHPERTATTVLNRVAERVAS